MEKFFATLPGGIKMPLFGLGTWLSKPEETRTAVEHAIAVGYRAIDTAWIYGNETEVGQAIKNKIADGTVTREQLFITTKLWSHYHRHEDVEKFKLIALLPTSSHYWHSVGTTSSRNKRLCKSARCLDESLARLQLDYVDLYLIHTPCSFKKLDFVNKIYELEHVKIEETWKGMQGVVKAGKARAIGVSNFNESQMQRIIDVGGDVKLATNQVEYNVYIQRPKMVEFCQKNNVLITAYAPLGSPGKPRRPEDVANSCMDDECVKRISAKYNKTPAQVLIRFLLQRGFAVIPKSVNPGRIAENADVLDFELETAEMDELLSLDRNTMEFTMTHIPDIVNHPEFPWGEYVKGN